MKKYYELLKNIPLFQGIAETDIAPLLACLSAKKTHFERNTIVFMSGDSLHHFGIVLSGQVQIYQEDYYGNKNILSHVGTGHLFGESFACANVDALPVSVLTVTDSDLLFIDCARLAFPCTHACAFHSRLIQNMLNIIAMNNISLMQKFEITTRRTTREKLLAYLSAEAQKVRGSHFSIPFNRQELADYLSVDRSAMSAELGRLRDEGLLKFHKNQFELLQ
jgi:CRP-like cAMP-binding protein